MFEYVILIMINGVVDMSDMLVFFTNAGYSVSSICICLSILFAYFLKKREKKVEEKNRHFIYYLWSIIIMSIVEIFYVLYFVKIGFNGNYARMFYYGHSVSVLFATFSAWRYVISYRLALRSDGQKTKKNHYIPFWIVAGVEIIIAILTFVLPVSVYESYGFFTFESLPVKLMLIFVLISSSLFVSLVYYKNDTITKKDSVPIVIALGFVCLILLFRIVTGIDINIESFQFTIFALGMFFTVENQDYKLLTLAKQKQEYAQKATRAQKEFLANLSHEIHSPMNTILGYSQLLLQESELTKEGVYGDMVNIHDASLSLLGLINNITDFSSLISGKEELDENDYDIKELLVELNNDIITKIANNKVSIGFNVSETIPKRLKGDLNKILKIIYNVLCNAIVYSTTGEINISISGNKKEDGLFRLQFIIRTNGNSKQEEVFDINSAEFMTLSYEGAINSDTLGLLVAKSLSEILKGKLEFKYNADEGSKYVLDVDQKIIDPIPIGNEVNSILGGLNAKIDLTGKRILVIDNNNDNNMLIKRLLDKYNCFVDICTSHKDAFEAIKNNKYDVVFMEYIMSGVDGTQILSKLREIEPNLPPALAFVDNINNIGKDKYYESGFYDFLAKPVSYNELNSVFYKLFYSQNDGVQVDASLEKGGVSNV